MIIQPMACLRKYAELMFKTLYLTVGARNISKIFNFKFLVSLNSSFSYSIY